MDYLTAKEVAHLLRLSKDYVYKNFELFGGMKFGRALRFPKEVLDEILKEWNHECLQASRVVQSGPMEKRKEDLSKKRVQDTRRGRKGRKKGPKKSVGGEHELYRTLLDEM